MEKQQSKEEQKAVAANPANTTLAHTAPNQNASQNSQLANRLSGFTDNLNKYEKTVASLLGEKHGMSAKEFMVSIMNAVKKSPKLLECDPKSLFGAILLSAELKLKPNTPEGFAYIIPYGKEAQFQIGYKGLIEIAMRSSKVKGIKGVAVYENEYYEETSFGTINHIAYTGMDTNIMQLVLTRTQFLQRMGLQEEDINNDIAKYRKKLENGKGEVVLAYAVCYMEGLENPIWASVTKDVLTKIKGLSQAGNSQYSPYNNNTDVHNSMQFKAAIKKLFKFLPKQDNSALARAVEVDDKAMAGSITIANEDGTIEVVEVVSTKLNDGQAKEVAQENLAKLTGDIKPTKTEEKKVVGKQTSIID